MTIKDHNYNPAVGSVGGKYLITDLDTTDASSGNSIIFNGTIPVWQTTFGVQQILRANLDLNFSGSSYTLTTTIPDSGTFVVGEQIIASPYAPYDNKIGTFDIGGEPLFVTSRIQYGIIGGTFSPGDTITGSISGATAKVVFDSGADTMSAYSLNNIPFSIPDVMDNGTGATADFLDYQQTVGPFPSATLLPIGDDGSTLFLVNSVIGPQAFSGIAYLVGSISGATARLGGVLYEGGKVAEITDISGSTLTIKNIFPVGDFFTGDQIIGGTSGAEARAGVTTLISGNDQHFVMGPGNEFVLINLVIANNTSIPTFPVDSGFLWIYDGPNRTGNELIKINLADIGTALSNTTNSFSLSGVGGAWHFSSYTQTKTVSNDIYVSLDNQNGSPCEATLQMIAYITS